MLESFLSSSDTISQIFGPRWDKLFVLWKVLLTFGTKSWKTWLKHSLFEQFIKKGWCKIAFIFEYLSCQNLKFSNVYWYRSLCCISKGFSKEDLFITTCNMSISIVQIVCFIVHYCYCQPSTAMDNGWAVS